MIFNILGPSEGAWSGLLCVSIKTAATPIATAALDNGSINSLCPSLDVPLPPGCWTECVASNITGYPNSLIVGIALKSLNKVLYQ